MPDRAVLATTVVDEGMVLLHLRTSQYYSLNGTGAQIWQGIQAQQSVGELSQRLVARYAISPADADTAVQRLIAELVTASLVQAKNGH